MDNYSDTDLVPVGLRDLASRLLGLGGTRSSTYTIINGINNQNGLPAAPVNTDKQGFTFFTRPCLNLSYDNVVNSRRMAAYANQDPYGMANAIRCMLHPKDFNNLGLMSSERHFAKDADGKFTEVPNGQEVRSAIFDDEQAFITILTNTLINISGFPDFSVDVYTSPEGYAKEQMGWVDSVPGQYGNFSATANFANIEGDPITQLFHCWTEYATRVLTGSMRPFPHNIVQRRVDYFTRIYRLVMDNTNTYVQHIGATLAFPMSTPTGAVFNYSNDTTLSEEGRQISVPFQCFGFEPDDPILIKEFNYTVGRFNPSMATLDDRLNSMFKLDNHDDRVWKQLDPDGLIPIGYQKRLLNYKAFPYINSQNELEWWVRKYEFNHLLRLLRGLEDPKLLRRP